MNSRVPEWHCYLGHNRSVTFSCQGMVLVTVDRLNALCIFRVDGDYLETRSVKHFGCRLRSLIWSKGRGQFFWWSQLWLCLRFPGTRGSRTRNLGWKPVVNYADHTLIYLQKKKKKYTLKHVLFLYLKYYNCNIKSGKWSGFTSSFQAKLSSSGVQLILSGFC